MFEIKAGTKYHMTAVTRIENKLWQRRCGV
jgi:hypothetical protein